MKKLNKVLLVLLAFIIFIIIANKAGLISIKFDKEEFNEAMKKNDTNAKKSSSDSKNVSSNIVLDAMQYWTSKSSTISEEDLIKQLGEPDSIEEWDYKASYQVLVDKTPVYPIRTLYYGNYEYLFNDGMLQRININEEIPYDDVADILGMFGLRKYSNTEIKNNNVSYRVSNCGVPDFWVYSMDQDSLNGIKISYGTFWGE